MLQLLGQDGRHHHQRVEQPKDPQETRQRVFRLRPNHVQHHSAAQGHGLSAARLVQSQPRRSRASQGANSRVASVQGSKQHAAGCRTQRRGRPTRRHQLSGRAARGMGRTAHNQRPTLLRQPQHAYHAVEPATAAPEQYYSYQRQHQFEQ